MGETLIKVQGVSKKFCRSLRRSLWYGVCDLTSEALGHRHTRNSELREDEFWAIRDISFEVERGQCLGLVGRNGAGKTTLLKMLNGLLRPDTGRIEIRGRVGALISLGAGFNPLLTGRENVYVNAALLGLSKREIDSRFEGIVEFADIGKFIDAPVQSYSSGMHVRLGFAVATAIEPDILVLDEILAVGDLSFRKKCYSAIGKIKKNCATIIVNHNLSHLSQICDFGICLGIEDSAPTVQPIEQSISTYIASQEPTTSLARFETAPDNEITNLSLDPREVTASPNDDLRFVSALDLTKAGRYNLRCFIRNGSDEIVAEWSTFCQGKAAEFPPGKNMIGFEWSNLCLAPGKYAIEIIIYELDGLVIAASLYASNYLIVLGQSYGPAGIALGYPKIAAREY